MWKEELFVQILLSPPFLTVVRTSVVQTGRGLISFKNSNGRQQLIMVKALILGIETYRKTNEAD